jgi:hypothetical protein
MRFNVLTALNMNTAVLNRIATGYGLQGRDSFPGRVRTFLHRVQTVSGSHAAFYPMNTVGYFLGNKAAGS